MKKISSLHQNLFPLILLLCLFFLKSCSEKKVTTVSLVTDQNLSAQVVYGVGKVEEMLLNAGFPAEKRGSVKEASGETIIVAGLIGSNGPAAAVLKEENLKLPETQESFTIRKVVRNDKLIWVVGGYDDRGLMYGLLDVADRIKRSSGKKSFSAEMKEISDQPEVTDRALSIYTMHRAYWESRFYDEAYWDRYLDMLAGCRFNSLVVIFGYENGGFLAPCYPYFFNVEEFPGVKMVGMTEAEQQRNLAALNRLIDEAHMRGIRFTVGIWDHIYRGGVQGGGIPGAAAVSEKPVPGLVWGLNGDNLMPYTKAALAKFVRLVPGLDGIQFRMHDESGLKKEEQEGFWAGVFGMIKATHPEMRLDLRAKGLPDAVIKSAIDSGIKFRITTKYWMEQMGLPFHPSHINRGNQFDRRHSYADMLSYPQRYNMHWRLWTGGTSRILLWGDPEYVKRFAGSTHLYNGEGFEVNEPLATKMLARPHDERPFELLNPEYKYYDYEFERYWPFFLAFGRGGYNPGTATEAWEKEFQLHFGKKVAPLLSGALQQASRILPRIVASCYPYSAFPTTRGWAEKQRLGNLPLYAGAEGSDIEQFANFDEEAQRLIEGGETAKIRPPENSLWLKEKAEEVLSMVSKAETAAGSKKSKEFTSWITDLKILSNLALYHSARIPAAVNYRLFERTKDAIVLDAAIAYESEAVEAWKGIVEAAGNVYSGNLAFGVHLPQGRSQNALGFLDGHWKDELTELEKGLEQLKQQRVTLAPESKIQPAPHYQVAGKSDFAGLFQISHKPVALTPAGKPAEIIVKVKASNGLKWVRLRFRNVNQHFDYQTLECVPSGEKDTWRAVIPAEQINPAWDLMYFIEVMDKEGNGLIYPDLNSETPCYFVIILRD